ncbi:unnamed protein product (macronuclear) [Paramecium tetraurelia]|uniref:Uncharacterized protein n=1 Tax=Paramecium tetraurelia TaxID=5888 RepID=A0BI72_PARTE|nr:uncharacterized protein GSPATT00029275001 [Paramecium tetraurelia]CAK58239.1 unnamed protein product [Paramecium tetraurelia]|eukprot:XP_001425637.1 hypothetical protein (macronuclear) [Paramecium tetraurelia strain d4-2]
MEFNQADLFLRAISICELQMKSNKDLEYYNQCANQYLKYKTEQNSLTKEFKICDKQCNEKNECKRQCLRLLTDQQQSLIQYFAKTI